MRPLDLTALNLAITDEFGGEFALERAHNLELLKSQYDQLEGRGDAYRVAYVANGIHRLKPFRSNNTRTAVSLILQDTNVQCSASEIAGYMKHGIGTEQLVESLQLQ